MREYEEQGQKFIDIDVMEHPNITVTMGGNPIVVVRDGVHTVVNVLTYISTVKPHVNNVEVDVI